MYILRAEAFGDQCHFAVVTILLGHRQLRVDVAQRQVGLAAIKFADLYAQTRDPRALADYEALLADLEASFSALAQRLHEGGRTDMDIEISVLRDRLAREGVRPPAPAEPSEPAELERPMTLDDLLIPREPTRR